MAAAAPHHLVLPTPHPHANPVTCPHPRTAACDYTEVYRAAYSTTKCNGTLCRGSFRKPPGRK